MADTQPTAAELAPYIAIYNEVNETALFLAAAWAMFFYDYFLTLNDEINYIWPSVFSLVKLLFLVNRYLTPALLLLIFVGSGSFIHVPIKVLVFLDGMLMVGLFGSWNGTSNNILITTVTPFLMSCPLPEALMAVRVHALYERSKKIRWFVAGFWVATAGAALGLTIHQMMQIIKTTVTIVDIKVCLPGQVMPKFYWTVWVPPIVYETGMFILTMARMVQFERTFNISGLRTLLIRDGMAYYLIVTGSRIVNLVFFIRGNPATIYQSLFIFLGLGSSVVSRMVLNLRSWGDSSEHGGASSGGVFFDGPSRVSRGNGPRLEALSMKDLASYRNRSNPANDVDMTADAPYQSQPLRDVAPRTNRYSGHMSPRHHVVIQTETVVVEDEEMMTDIDADKYSEHSKYSGFGRELTFEEPEARHPYARSDSYNHGV